MRHYYLLTLGLWVGAFSAGAQAPESTLAKGLIAEAGVTHGVCAMLGSPDDTLALDLLRNSHFLLHVMEPNGERCTRLRASAAEAHFDLHRLVVEERAGMPLPYTENFLDAVFALDPPELNALSPEGLLQALRPGGKAILLLSKAEAVDPLKAWARAAGARMKSDALGTWATLEKPTPPGMDDWTHWEHRPDNNPVSTDQLIKAPYMTQWLAQPYYIAMPAITLAAGGRTFLAMGHIAHHEREEQWLNTIFARNGYNGQELWRKRLPDGYLVHRSAFVATADTFYMIDLTGHGCLMLDPETGREKGRIDIPQLTGEWKWMAIQDGVLYVLSGAESDPTQMTVVRSKIPAWSWSELSTGYYQERIPWGFGETIAAYDMKTSRAKWVHQENARVDSRAMAIGDGHVFFYGPDSHLACLDTQTGQIQWANDDPKLRALIDEPGQGLSSTPGFRTTCFCVYTPKGLFFEGQTKMNLVAVNKDTGALMWHHRKTTSNPNVIYVDDSLYAGIGAAGNTLKLDPLTGTLIQDLGFRKRSCARLTATPDSLFCRGYDEGVTRFDRLTGKITFDGSMRPACNDGMMGANGLLYSGPWLCDCNLSIIGAVAQCSAKGFDPASVQGERTAFIEPPARDQAARVSRGDWYAYRGGNEHSGSSKTALSRVLLPVWTWHGTNRAEEYPEKEMAPEGTLFGTAPVAAWGKVFLAGEDGFIRAFDAATGVPQWSFATAGPIMQPPALWHGRVYTGSGDGNVYALDAETGQLIWRFRAAPVERRTMVYGFLDSIWPVNSGVVIKNGTAYFAAGIIDYNGTYVYAVDAETGELRWVNNSTGHINKDLRKGVSAQGNLTLMDDALWLSPGNVMPPAPYALDSGAFLSKEAPEDGAPTDNRGEEIGVFQGKYLIHGGRLRYSANDNVVNPGLFSVFTRKGRAMDIARGSIVPAWDDELLVCSPTRELPPAAYSTKAIEERLERGGSTVPSPLWSAEHFKDNQILGLALAQNAVAVVCETPSPRSLFPRYRVCLLERSNGEPFWEHNLPSVPRMNGIAIDRDGRLIVALRNGGLAVFGDTGALSACLTGLAKLPEKQFGGEDELKRRLLDALGRVQNEEGRKMLFDTLLKHGVDAAGAVLANGAVARWRLLEPLPWDPSNAPNKPLIGEPDLHPDHPVKWEKQTLNWREYTSADEEGEVDLADIYGQLENKAVYAYAEIECPQAQDLTLTVGCNDGHVCWFNGQEVGRFDGGRRYIPGQDHFTVHAKAGMNRIVLKVTQLGGAWGFNVRFLRADGQPAPIHQR